MKPEGGGRKLSSQNGKCPCLLIPTKIAITQKLGEGKGGGEASKGLGTAQRCQGCTNNSPEISHKKWGGSCQEKEKRGKIEWGRKSTKNTLKVPISSSVAAHKAAGARKTELGKKKNAKVKEERKKRPKQVFVWVTLTNKRGKTIDGGQFWPAERPGQKQKDATGKKGKKFL